MTRRVTLIVAELVSIASGCDHRVPKPLDNAILDSMPVG
jgi:hypothetical protein